MSNLERQHVQNLEATLEKLVDLSASFMKMDAWEVNYQGISDAFREISGARIVLFNLYGLNRTYFTTMAISGLTRHIEKLNSMLGFGLLYKTWNMDAARQKSLGERVLERFDELSEMAGDQMMGVVAKRIQLFFSFDSVYRMTLMVGERIIGDFTFVMPLGHAFTQQKASEIFTRQIGLLLSNRHTEEELRNQGATLIKVLENHRLLTNIAVELNSVTDFDERINNCLKSIGLHTGLGRVYIFENGQNGSYTSNTYEWCSEGTGSRLKKLRKIHFSTIPGIRERLIEKGALHTDDIKILDETTRSVLHTQGVKSMLMFPINVKDAFFGFIGLDNFKSHACWEDTDMEMLRAIAGIMSNAFERRIMEKSLEVERDKAKMASKAKSQFLANISHEIRTPMTAILGYSEALYERVEPDESKKMVESIQASGKLLLSLINDILDLSMIEAGKLELVIQPVRPASIFEEAKALFSEKARQKGLEFFYDMSREMPPMLNIDETRVRQIIFSLMSNAIKFTAKGYVLLAAWFDQKHPNYGNLHITVEDTGVGIPEDYTSVIFEEFSQVSQSDNMKPDGAGLGLSICKRLVDKMNGTIDVESIEGKGSVFRVMLPGIAISQDFDVDEAAESEQASISFSKSHVLVVDDALSDIEIIESMMVSLGLEVSHALGGRQALNILKFYKPSLIILGTRLQEMNSYEFLQKIKNDPVCKEIPVVAFSSSIPGYSSNPLWRLFSGHILKPARKQTLVSELARHLPHSFGSPPNSITTETPEQTMISREELPEKAGEMLKILQLTFLTKWRLIKEQMVIFKIESFANELEVFASAHRFNYLLQYARKLSKEANDLDIDAMNETLMRFPAIVDRIRALAEQ